MTSDAPQSATGCPDGGACHHHCVTGCWRVATCSPLSAYGEKWTTADRREYGTVVQEWPTTTPAAAADASEERWGTRTRRVLDYLHTFIAEHGYPPSLAQIGAAVGLTSSSSVAHQLQVLEARGYIAREPGSPRAITLLADHDDDLTKTPDPATLLLEYTHWLFDRQWVTGDRFDHLPEKFLAEQDGDPT